MRFQTFTYTKGTHVCKFFILANIHEGVQFESYAQWATGVGFDSQNIKNGSMYYQCHLKRKALEREGWQLCYSVDKNDMTTPLGDLKRMIITEYQSCTNIDILQTTLVRSFKNIGLNLDEFIGLLNYTNYGDW